MQPELKSNALSSHSNLGGYTDGNIGLFMTNMNYATLSPVAYVRPVYPGILKIPNNATRVASYKLKRVYDKNIRVFHEVRGSEQAIIHQVVTAINEQYIIYTKNFNTGKFTGNIRQIFADLLSAYRKSHQVI